MINLMIVEDNELVLQGLSRLLALESGILIAAQAIDGNDAMEQLGKGIQIDIMLVDWNMPNMNGLELTRLVKTQIPDIKVIILTMHGKEDYRIQALDAGAAAYVLKDLNIEELAEVIQNVHTGIYGINT